MMGALVVMPLAELTTLWVLFTEWSEDVDDWKDLVEEDSHNLSIWLDDEVSQNASVATPLIPAFLVVTDLLFELIEGT